MIKDVNHYKVTKVRVEGVSDRKTFWFRSTHSFNVIFECFLVIECLCLGSTRKTIMGVVSTCTVVVLSFGNGTPCFGAAAKTESDAEIQPVKTLKIGVQQVRHQVWWQV